MTSQSSKTSAIPPDWRAEIVVIGCSTGGPVAVQKVLQSLPKGMPAPIVVAQHMPKGFTKQFADRLNTLCALKVVEGENGVLLQAGTAYILPAGYLTSLKRNSTGRIVLQVDEADAAKWLYRPSVDLLFSTAATAAGTGVLAVVMTGMGRDGAKGAQTVRQQGGYVITESEETAVIYGMPRAVYESGASNLQVPLSDIATVIQRYTSSR